MTLSLRKIEAGVWEEPGGKFRAERVDSLTEYWSIREQRFTEGTSSVWVVTERPNEAGDGEWPEIAERQTKRDCAQLIERLLAEERETP